ncbi:MAG: beta-lactamase family protein [Pseudomonadaceae bacterium]|nr:beta-lactamase family protein [Pseudomonadaceae bacterium]
MRKVHLPFVLFFFLVVCFANAAEESQLEGLWSSYKRFGPDIYGSLLIDKDFKRAEVGSYAVDVSNQGDRVHFELPDGLGQFVGRVQGEFLVGHWIQPAPLQIGQKMASPVTLEKLRSGSWQGFVDPRSSEYTFYLPITSAPDGSYSTFLRNPDRNLGLFGRVQKIEQDGRELSFIGGFFNSEEKQQIASGTYDEEFDVVTLVMPPWRGGTFDFHRVNPDSHSAFYPGLTTQPSWDYSPPPQLDDGWSTSTLEEVGLDIAPLRRMLEEQILQPDDNIHSHRVHAILIARHGKLVFEEYFHGFDRNTPHDTRSASKSVASMLVGAAAYAGHEIGVDTRVYEKLRGGQEEIDPRKQVMSLRHLLTMSSGFYCDDNDSNAPGNENIMQEQTEEADWYTYTLDLPMAEAPGETAIYCSANSNLIGAVLSASTGKTLLDLFSEMIAKPLDISRYYLGLQPTGEPYFGGGAHWLPRDFMKIGQVVLNRGTWNGRRVFSKQWAVDSTQMQVKIGERAYGYQWWINEYPYKEGTVQAFFAAGNGGQIVMGVPELDLLIAFFGGNYSDPVLMRAQNVLIPEYILKAVR